MKRSEIQKTVAIALAEDRGKVDITAILIPKNRKTSAKIIAKEGAIICGRHFATEAFKKVDSATSIRWFVKDGDRVKKGKILCIIKGRARSIVTAERVALNFLQLLSGTATLTNKYVAKLKNSKTKLLDTRKTIPGLRLAQKYAVKTGGGHNHRFGLYDAILIKENHIAACDSITAAISRAKKLYPRRDIEIEVKDLKELNEASDAKPSRIMLDNFDLKKIRQAVKLKRGRIKLEASGNINLKNIRKIGETGVDYISVGEITKKVIPVDLSLLFSENH